jgi:excisionase family DNA binding protein
MTANTGQKLARHRRDAGRAGSPTLVPDDAYSGPPAAGACPQAPDEKIDPAPTSSPSLLLTIEEAADRLRVGRCTMQALLLAGEVRSFKIGRLRRIPPEALTEYIEHQLTG